MSLAQGVMFALLLALPSTLAASAPVKAPIKLEVGDFAPAENVFWLNHTIGNSIFHAKMEACWPVA